MKNYLFLLALFISSAVFSQECPTVFTEPGQLYFQSTVPLEFDDDEIEIESGDNESEYEYAGSYTQTQGGVIQYYVYYFELEEGSDWDGVTPFEVEFENPDMTCYYPQDETLSVTSQQLDNLKRWSIDRGVLTINEAESILVYDMTGRLASKALGNRLDISTLANGIYICKTSKGLNKVTFRIRI